MAISTHLLIVICLILIVWTTQLICTFNTRAEFTGPFRQLIRKWWPRYLFSEYLIFILYDIYISYRFIHSYHRIDLFIGIEVYLLISTAILIFLIFRKRRSQSGKNLTTLANDNLGCPRNTWSLWKNDDRIKDFFIKVAVVILFIGIAITVISQVSDYIVGVEAGLTIAIIGFCIFNYFGSISKKYRSRFYLSFRLLKSSD